MKVWRTILQSLVVAILSFPLITYSQTHGDIFGEDQAQQDQKFSDVRRQWELEGRDPDRSTAPGSKRQQGRHFITLMQHDPEFNIASIPLSRWLNDRATTEIPWNIEVSTPQLRMDQRIEIPYKAKIGLKQLKKYGGSHDLFFIVGVSSPDGNWLVEPKVVHAIVRDSETLNDADEVWFSDWCFSRPGLYELWFVLFDQQAGRHSTAKRRVQVQQLRKDPLPHLTDGLRDVKFPLLTDREGGSVLGIYGSLNLPVKNKEKVSIELMPILNYSELSTSRSFVRNQSEQMVEVLSTLSQMHVANGSISVTAVDVIGRQIPFRHLAVDRPIWADLFRVFLNTNDVATVSKADLLAENNPPTFLRQAISDQLMDSDGSIRILVIVSTGLTYEQSKLQSLTLQGNCNCRVFHLRLDASGNEADLLESVLPDLRSTTFEVRTPFDMRKALASIVSELERF
jgi:hypothetical protein